MSWVYYNPNPVRFAPTGDCAIRAISKALDVSWDTAHDLTSHMSKMMGEVQNNNAVIGAVLRQNGFIRKVIPNYCPDCYTIQEFCDDHPEGIYVLGTGNHVVAVESGSYFDSWDSGMEVPIFYWELVY